MWWTFADEVLITHTTVSRRFVGFAEGEGLYKLQNRRRRAPTMQSGVGRLLRGSLPMYRILYVYDIYYVVRVYAHNVRVSYAA